MKDIVKAIERLREVSGNKTHKIIKEDIDSLIEKCEEKIGFIFSDDYKFFLEQTCSISFGTLDPFCIYTIDDLIEYTKEGRSIGLPYDWLPICEDNGDYYCLLPDGTVRFWDHNGTTDEKWDSLADWVEKVWIEEELEE